MFKSQIIKSIFKNCLDDRCPQIAASLAYTTLLALIPLTVITYKIYSTASIDQAWQLRIQEIVFNSLTPDTAEQVRQYLFESAVHASKMNILGLVMLLVSVLIMMQTIDSALNSIWKISNTRKYVQRFLVYLALLIFGPLAIFFSLFISTYIASFPLISDIAGGLVEIGISNWLPFIVLWFAFTMLYKWVPQSNVSLLHAFSGATFAVCFLEIAKNIFSLYVRYFPTYEFLYGALASIPLLLIWIYLTWLIVLIGAEIAHFMQIAK